MNRQVAFLAEEFRQRADESLDLVARLEINKISYKFGAGRISPRDIEYIYEIAYLQIFGFWEDFLDRAFVRYLCGYSGATGREPLIGTRSYYSSIEKAKAAMLGSKNYLAWYVPSDVVGRCRIFFAHSNFEFVIASAATQLNNHRRIRHQIAHVQDHARSEFDAVTRSLATRAYPRSSPGKFLRDELSRSTSEVWLRYLSDQLADLASQICPR